MRNPIRSLLAFVHAICSATTRSDGSFSSRISSAEE
jgi:hypothetical protein